MGTIFVASREASQERALTHRNDPSRVARREAIETKKALRKEWDENVAGIETYSDEWAGMGLEEHAQGRAMFLEYIWDLIAEGYTIISARDMRLKMTDPETGDFWRHPSTLDEEGNEIPGEYKVELHSYSAMFRSLASGSFPLLISTGEKIQGNNPDKKSRKSKVTKYKVSPYITVAMAKRMIAKREES